MNINTKTIQTDAGKRNFSSPAVFVLALVGVVGSMLTATAVQADTLYKTGFENPPFVASEPLLQFVNPTDPTGLDGWGNIPPLLNPSAAFITNIAAKSSRQSVEVSGASLISSGGQTGPYDAIGSYRRPVNHTISGNKSVVLVDADILLKTNKPKTPGEFFSLTLAARSGVGETLGEIGLASNGIVEAWSFNAPGGSAPSFTKPIRFNKWYHITMLHDFKHETTTYFIDDHFLGSTPAPSAEPNVLLRGAMVVYARPDGGDEGGTGSERSNYTARFDNFRISVHSKAPEID